MMNVGSSTIRCTFFVLLTAAVGCGSSSHSQAETKLGGAFVVKPYIQLGDPADPRKVDGLDVVWHAADVDADWKVEYRAADDQPWRSTNAPRSQRIAVVGQPPHRVYRAGLRDLAPGGVCSYRVVQGDEVVFSSTVKSPKAKDQPHRFVVFGDCGAGTPGEKAVAYQVHSANPDYVMITGDIVYSRGRVSEYRDKFWPVYNADEASRDVGAPLLRSTLFLAAAGNHDIADRDLGKNPDGLAFFFYWNQPRNGPALRDGGPHVPPLTGPEENQKAFRESAGDAYPGAGNFSFDYGNAHWTVLDTNAYVNWTAPEMRAWVERDLAAARDADWRFVSFHQPPFNSSKAHFADQLTRVLADVFEAGKVDVVFSGHVHNYQRTYPLRFTLAVDAAGRPAKQGELLGGSFVLDRAFDGRTVTRPQGVIYLVTGAGGATLYDPGQQDDPDSWQEFTHKFVSKIHSLTVADVQGKTLTVRQVSADGDELDKFSVTK
ncbi:MAG: metallophosphoesterase [Paludisphaera borealis]|uniref:metallophosphoesterase n=1 Tax=Paludisphaera borealis TaxID=1387353 RepID=UPI002843E7AB|nr:metallophosphoesterase [Paludisphaera borealis]MDR3620433.1 metallophosphoesterase [Paludisphaera borealis]